MARAAHTRWWQIAEVMFGIPVLVAIGLQVVFPVRVPYGRFAPFVVAGGGLLGLASVVLIIAARRELARHGQPTDPGQPTRRLVTTGVFAWSRNPLYLSAVLLLCGIALAGNLPWLIAALLPAVGLCHLMLIIPEERYLDATFGAAYQAYAAAVPRWVGLRQRHH
jgi:protein-S-isoprenylcysteine O-methyltransferase Ste14